jgi:glycosyltransferase involved in cell wall biosynthesis
MKICLIIPLYNESNRFNSEYFKTINDLKIDLIFVNDGSSDDTLVKLKNLSFRKHIISYKNNKGKGEAIRAGINYAIKEKYDLIGYLDSDGAFSVESVIKTIEIAKKEFMINKKLGMIIAARVKLSGREIIRTNSRKIVSSIIKIILSLILKNKPYDTQSGFKILRNTNNLKNITKNKFFTKWFFDVELIESIKKEYYVYEIPVDRWVDVSGSKLSYKMVFKILREIIILLKLYR